MIEKRREPIPIIPIRRKRYENEDKILKEKRNLISSLIVKDVNDKFMTIKLQNESWINEGDTLVTVDYITYLRHYNRRLLIDDMITNTNELDSITQMILKKSNLKIFSPNGNIAILGDSILFYYNNIKVCEVPICASETVDIKSIN